MRYYDFQIFDQKGKLYRQYKALMPMAIITLDA